MTCMTGFDGKVYINTGADYENPTWTEIPMVKAVSISSSSDKIDDTDRGSVFKKFCAGQMDLECTMNLSYRAGNATLKLLRDAHLERTSKDFMVLDGPESTTGSEGFRFTAKVFSHDWDQPMTDIMSVDVTLAPTYAEDTNGDEIEPAWITRP